MSQNRKSTKSGFTLIELLVVIAIIAILASILFPVFITAKQSAQRTSCLNNLKQLGIAFTQYRSDYGGYFPMGGFLTAGSDHSNEWQNVIWKYVKKDAIFRCPVTASPDVSPSDPGNPGTNPNAYRTPVTYLYNQSLGADMANIAANQISPHGHAESEVVSAAKCIVLIDGNPGAPRDGSHFGKDCHGQSQTLWLDGFTFYQYCSNVTGGDSPKSLGLPAHGNGGMVSFVDGHVAFKQWNSKAILQKSLPWLVHVPLCSDHCPAGAYQNNPQNQWK